MNFNRFEFSLPSLRLVAIPKLKSSVCRTIYPELERIVLSIPFPSILVLCEMQAASSRI